MIIILAIFCACCQNSAKSDSKAITSTISNEKLSIDTFSTFPPEIDGCSCYFSNDSIEFKHGKYIYVNDFGEVSFLNINGEMIKFKQTEYKAIDSLTTEATGNSGEFELKIRIIKGRVTGDETQLQTGTLTIIDKKGNKSVKKFYGECGC